MLTGRERAELDAALAVAARAGDGVEVEALAAEGASPDAEHRHDPHIPTTPWQNWWNLGPPAIVCAAQNGHSQVLELLLRLGADPNASSRGNSVGS